MKTKTSRIVADGPHRAREGFDLALPEIRARVAAALERKYASALNQAGPLRRCWIRLRIAWEVRRTLRLERKRISSPHSLY